MEHLKQLRTIRSIMGERGTSSSEELEALRGEHTLLQRQSTKQAYRIEHIVVTVEELLAKQNQNN
jgi:hypothetical protein